DILTALRIAKEFNIRLTLDHCTEGYLIPELIKEGAAATGAGVIIGPLLSDRSKIELRNQSFEAPRILYENGVEFAMMTDHPVIPEQYLPVCASIAVKEGLPEYEALKSITINAARIVGIDDRVGSIEVGKDADIAVFNGDPLDVRARCVLTVINGEICHDERN
ncbi:MAG: amidohydrolase family protein, partial [Clostridia bacterium]|nr:amidohydrolase family protein [Clostridia bacterium]